MRARPCLISPPEGVDVLNAYVCLSPRLQQLDARILLELVDNALCKPTTEEQWPPRTQERLAIISDMLVYMQRGYSPIHRPERPARCGSAER